MIQHGKKPSKKAFNINDIEKYLDPGIRDFVLLLNQNGFKTFMSCEGGKGHAFRYAVIGLIMDCKYLSCTVRYSEFYKKLNIFLRQQGVTAYEISLTTFHHPASGVHSYVYLESMQMLSRDKYKRVKRYIDKKIRIAEKSLQNKTS